MTWPASSKRFSTPSSPRSTNEQLRQHGAPQVASATEAEIGTARAEFGDSSFRDRRPRQGPVTRATRVRKARAWSVCALCPVMINVGQLIGRLPAGGWAHASCVIRTQTPAASPATAAPPTEGKRP